MTIVPRVAAVAMVGLALAAVPPNHTSTTQVVSIRGQRQTLRVYGRRGNPPVIVSSGDGGWMHLGPHVAELLAARGFFVVGFDTRAYLSGFTAESGSLRPDEEAGDYAQLAAFAAAGHATPILVGVSEGAGLSVLAAAAPAGKGAFAGVVGLGLPDLNELGWRWKDAVIYLTHGVPKEPLFSAADVIGRVAPLPVALLQSTHDEFVSPADTRRLFGLAGDPKRLWLIDGSDHRFSGRVAELDDRLLEAIAWIGQEGGRS